MNNKYEAEQFTEYKIMYIPESVTAPCNGQRQLTSAQHSNPKELFPLARCLKTGQVYSSLLLLHWLSEQTHSKLSQLLSLDEETVKAAQD